MTEPRTAEEVAELSGVMALLAEIGRLDLDLLLRDLGATEALEALEVLREELERLLCRAEHQRRLSLDHLTALEQDLSAQWPGGRASTLLADLAVARRTLVDLDCALGPACALFDELERRCSRRLTVGEPAAASLGGERAGEAKEPEG